MHVHDEFRIVPLADAADTIPILARLFIEEWEPYYGPDGPGDATNDLKECCNRDDLPTAVVALDDDGTVLGTAALKTESVGAELGVGPWLSALVVPIEHRKRGIGTALIDTIEKKAHCLGLESIYVSTDAAENIIRHRGWTALEDPAESLRGPVAVYKLQLSTKSFGAPTVPAPPRPARFR
ncbi:MAG: GNAT family N-acetyltransferase [Gammaproteobacteria bacterium]